MRSRVGNNDGKWFFVDYESRADKKIFFVDYESRSDLKIFFVNYESRAGWKMHPKTPIVLMKVIPKKGYSEKELHDFFDSFKNQDIQWKSGKTFGVYYPGDEYAQVISRLIQDF